MILTKLSLLDRRLTDHITLLTQKPMIIGFLKLFSHSADSLIVMPLLVLLWLTKPELQQELLLPLAGSLGLATLFTVILKFSIRRERPATESYGITHKTDPYTFPSGHSMRSSALAFSLLFSGYYATGAVFFLWALIIGTARIAKRMHYVSDILGGYTVGIVSAMVVNLLLI